jgi:hypothetical protein
MLASLTMASGPASEVPIGGMTTRFLSSIDFIRIGFNRLFNVFIALIPPVKKEIKTSTNLSGR